MTDKQLLQLNMQDTETSQKQLEVGVPILVHEHPAAAEIYRHNWSVACRHTFFF